MNEEPPCFEALLRGVSHRPIEAKAIVNDLAEGAALLLEREPMNQYDPNAIRVLEPESSEWLGFVAKEVAVDLAPWMDQGWHFSCTVGDRFSSSVVLLNIEPILPTEDEEKIEMPEYDPAPTSGDR